MEKSNDLRFNTSKEINLTNYKGQEIKGRIYVNIRLNDECRNGYQDFAITGDVYEHPTSKFNRYHSTGGCIHETILKYYPKFEPFIKLHLCDYNGVHTHAIANGMYHIKEGFNDTPANDPKFEEEFCNYYNINLDQFEALRAAENKIEYYMILQESGHLDKWKAQANEAIKQLETLTGKEFINDSVRSNLDQPTPEQINDFKQKKAAGYYTTEAKLKRAQEAKIKAYNDKVTKIKEEANKEIKKIRFERDLQLILLDQGINKDKYIYYNHTNTIVFNWNSGSYNKPLHEDIIKVAIYHIQSFVRRHELKIAIRRGQSDINFDPYEKPTKEAIQLFKAFV